MVIKYTTFFIGILLITSCSDKPQKEQDPANVAEEKSDNRIPILFDSDANNELDDQHALAYMLFSGESFNVRGVTVNATHSGGEIDQHFAEAERVMKLCNVNDKIPLYSGANGNFEEIRQTINEEEYDGKDAVEFIIEESRKSREVRLVLLPVGKLTNIALALEKAPDIKEKVRIVWLGSNYPEPGEYNQVNDIPSLNYILEQEVSFEMVMVRYGKLSGSDAVRATLSDIEEKMPNAGLTSDPVVGRHGNSFTNFGDYSVDLFNHIDLRGDPPSRALFDMVAVAIVKNPSWGQANEISAPILDGENWKDRPENKNKIIIWENFDSKAILIDFYNTMKNPVIAE